jgi:peptidoglycan/xylan/chitin deacetylase (PgdA/CDA1 family)
MSLSRRHQLFGAGFRALAASRADRWLAPLARGVGVILMFHHVRPWEPRDFAPNRILEITPDFLATTVNTLRSEGFDIIPIDDLPSRLGQARTARPFAVLTFDDGYRDNLEHGAPILRRHGAPWALFVTTEFADGRGRLWWLELEEAVARLDRVALDLGEARLDLPCRTAAEKQAAFEEVYWRLRAGPETALRDAIAALGRAAGIDPQALTAKLCLGWDELRILARDPAVTIGAHTVSHPMLAKHDAATVRRELRDSRTAIEQRLGRAVTHFAYPVGDCTSAGPREFEASRDAGFTTAVTTRPGHVFAAHAGHLHALPRVSVNGLFQTEAALRALLSGVPFLIFNRARQLNVS